MPVQVTNERVCEIVGFSGHRKVIDQTAKLAFSIGSFTMSKPHKFAVVESNSFPYCMLLGLDFMIKYGLDLDLKNNLCRQSGGSICPLFIQSRIGATADILTVRSVPSTSHVLKMESNHGEFRFEIEGASPTIMGLSLVNDDQIVRLIQTKCPQLKRLCKAISNNVDPKRWPVQISQFAKHHSSLSVENGILMYSNPVPVVAVPFDFLVGIVLVLHNEFAHVGRDKLLGLVRDLFWHPSRYKICNDVCTTCKKCQIVKEYSTVVSPPTFKIQSTYPFEILAADLISFPKTSQGFVGCLMAVYHFSKWVATVPIRDKKSSTVVRAFTYQILPFLPRVPTSLLTDNGPEFTSNEFSNFVERFSLKHRLTTPYQPTSNGAVERVNRTIKNLIRSLSDAGCAWEESLPNAVITYNNTTHVELGMSPADFLLKRPHDSEHALFPDSIKETWKVGHPNFSPFKVGQLVLAKVQMKGFLTTNKFQSNFTGPYEVTVVNSNGVTYQVRHVESAEVSRVHHTKLRVYRPPPGYISGHPYYGKYNGSIGDECVAKGTDLPGDYNFGYETNILSSSDSPVESSSESSSDFSGFTSVSSSLAERGRQLGAINKALNHNEPVKNIVASSPCRGCCFEAVKEELFTVAREVSAGDEPVEVVTEIPLGPVLADFSTRSRRFSSVVSCNNLFDWSNSDLLSILSSDETDFEIPSINSADMVDESQECFSQSDSFGASGSSGDTVIDMSLAQSDAGVADEIDNVNETENLTVNIDETFEGFDPDPLLYTRSVNLNRILSKPIENYSLAVDIGSTESVRQLRSKGPVPDQPRVQRLILERNKSKGKNKKYESA